MSRSFKRNPFCTEETGKLTKRMANKKVRQKLKDLSYEIGNNSNYKSLVESWDIHDYKWYETKEKAIAKFHQDLAMGYNTYDTEEEAHQDWCKWYKRK